MPVDRGSIDVAAASVGKIAKVTLRLCKFRIDGVALDPSGLGLVYAPGDYREVTRVACKVTAANGLTGQYLGGDAAAYTQLRTVAPTLLGLEAWNREMAYTRAKGVLRQLDVAGYGVLDIALWDLYGKAVGLPLAKLLGGGREVVPAYASSMAGDTSGGLDTPDKYARFAVECQELGYHGFKLHLATGATVRQMADTVVAVREAVGPDMRVMVDPGGKLNTWLDAWTLGRVCDEQRVAWLEDPYGPQSVATFGYRHLRERIATPLLISEHVRGVEQHATAVLSGATDIVRVDVEQDGGVTGALKIAHFAEALGLDVEIHRAGPVQRHLLSALRNSNYYEMGLVHPLTPATGLPGMVYADGYADGLHAVDETGCVPVPCGPGLGIDYDEARLDAAATSEFTI